MPERDDLMIVCGFVAVFMGSQPTGGHYKERSVPHAVVGAKGGFGGLGWLLDGLGRILGSRAR